MSDPQTEAEDWIKTARWDLDCNGEPVTTVPQLLYALSVSEAPLEDQKTAVQAFMKLPAWVPAPAALKARTLAFLAQP
jgi:hypothetical protein